MVKERKEGEGFLDLLIDNLPGVVFRFRADDDLTIEYISDGCRKLTGFNDGELSDSDKPASWMRLIHADDRGQISDLRRNFIERGIAPERNYIEYRILTKDLQLKNVCEHFGYVRDSDQNVIAIEGFIADVTKMAAYDRQIREKENEYRLLADYMHDMVCLHEPDGLLTYVSPSSKTVLGYAPEQLRGNSFEKLSKAEDYQATRSFIKKCIADCSPNIITELRMRKKSGRYIWVETMWQTIRNEANDVMHFLTVTRNINKRKLLEIEREENRRQLRQHLQKERQLRREAEQLKTEAVVANRAKDEFLQMVSHEFRTPLTTIKTLVSVLQNDRDFPAARREYLETIALECDHQIDLILNLLDVSRLEEGISDLQKQPTDINHVLKICDRIERPAAEAREQQLIVKLNKKLPLIDSDEKALRRALCSIIENAIKYTPEGGKIEIKSESSRRKSVNGISGRFLCVLISDNGRGIYKEDLPNVFNKFFRGRRIVPHDKSTDGTPDDAEGRAETPGVGLGLYLANRLVEALGGTITVESEVYKGSTFRIYLPIWNENSPSEENFENKTPRTQR